MRTVSVGILIGLLSILSSFGFVLAEPCKGRGIQFFLGPEIYHVQRVKEGGAEQTGTLYGVRGGFERIKRYKFYYALDGLFSRGMLWGKVNGNHIKSKFTNSTIETRFGYTFQTKFEPWFSFTPFIGAGYLSEYNQYVHPSPIKIHFDNQFFYVPLGFLSSFYPTNQLQLGLNVTVRCYWDANQRVTHDPMFSDQEQCFEEHIQYRIELPITYDFFWKQHCLAMRFTPFYEYRHYGHRANYPFDFLDTKFKFFGANFEILYRF
ncbi:MAG: hypothetical protein K2X39_03845 [Silvanigrellaceae bacterium]|nr:hypothetical protein [Silvanigrellaceae bacterium]